MNESVVMGKSQFPFEVVMLVTFIMYYTIYLTLQFSGPFKFPPFCQSNLKYIQVMYFSFIIQQLKQTYFLKFFGAV